MPVTTDMSESLSCHSVKLVSLARSLSELGVDAANGIPVTPPENEEPPLPVRTPHIPGALTSCCNMSFCLSRHTHTALSICQALTLHHSLNLVVVTQIAYVFNNILCAFARLA